MLVLEEPAQTQVPAPMVEDTIGEQADLGDLDEIARLATRLRRKNPVRMAADMLIQGARPPDDAIPSLLYSIQAPSGFRWRERIVAAWALSRMEVDETTRCHAASCLIRMLRRENEKDAAGRIGRMALRTGILSGALSILTSPATGIGAIPFFIVLSVVFSPFTFSLSSWIDSRRHDRVRAAAAEALGHVCIAESIGDLALAARDKNMRVRQRAANSFLPVAATITKRDYRRLDNWMVNAVFRLLSGRDDDLQRAALRALGEFGDGSALEPVQRVAKKGKTRELRALAESCLPILRERWQKENDTRILLRAADSPGAREEALLRPAGGSETPAERLLRAVEEEN